MRPGIWLIWRKISERRGFSLFSFSCSDACGVILFANIQEKLGIRRNSVELKAGRLSRNPDKCQGSCAEFGSHQWLAEMLRFVVH